MLCCVCYTVGIWIISRQCQAAVRRPLALCLRRVLVTLTVNWHHTGSTLCYHASNSSVFCCILHDVLTPGTRSVHLSVTPIKLVRPLAAHLITDSGHFAIYITVVVVSGMQLRLRSAIRRHHPPQTAVLSHICCFGERKVVLFQILLDGAEPRDAGTTWLSSPVSQRGG